MSALAIPTYLEVPDVAQMYHVEARTVYQWIYMDKIPYHKANGRVLFDLDELKDWSKNNAKKKNIDIHPRAGVR